MSRLAGFRSAWGGGAELRPADAAGLRRQGEWLLRGGALDVARERLGQAVALDPTDARALTCLSALAASAGECEAARAYIERAVAARPVSGPARPDPSAPTVLRLRAIDAGVWRVIRSRSGIWKRKFKGGHFSTEHLLNTAGLNKYVVSLIGDDVSALDGASPPDLILNAVACADRGRAALDAVARWLALRPGTAVINRPDRVRLTTRDENARRLGALDGVRFPRTLRVTAGGDPDAAARALAQAGLAAPLIVRAAGRQTGRDTFLCGDDRELVRVLAGFGPGQALYAIAFIDTRDPAGCFRKMRVFSIDGRLHPVACLTSDHWQIHSGDRYRLMTEDEDSRRREQAYLADPVSVTGPAAWEALGRVFEALGLDFAGADFTVTPKGELVVFEANAAMRHNFDHAGAFPYTRPYLERITDAFTAMVQGRAEAGRRRGQGDAGGRQC